MWIIQPILWKDPHRGAGKPVIYNPVWDLRVLMLRLILQIPYMKNLVNRLRRAPYLGCICGYGDSAPCEAHFSQMKRRISPNGFHMVEAHLRHEILCIRESQPFAAVGQI